jgi:DNA/RNA-binding protein KIN17
MRIFAQNPNSILDTFSKEFEKGYLQILSHSHGTKRVFANRVYQEYIADKNHVHMNSTVWTTLTGFCKYLGKEGKCIVDETEKGWYIQYIERDPEVLAKLAKREERKAVELNEEEINKKLIENQIKAAFDRIQQQQGEEKGGDEEKEEEDGEGGEEGSENEEGVGGDGSGEKKERKKKETKPIQVKLSSSVHAGHNNNDKKRLASSAFGINDDDEDDENEGKGKEDANEIEGKEEGITVGNLRHFGRKMGGAFEQLMAEQEKRKKMKASIDEKKIQESATSSSSRHNEDSTSKIKNERDNDNNNEKLKTWIMKGILVKVTNKLYLDGKYYKMKGSVVDVWKSSKHDFYELEIEFYDEEKGRKKYEKFRESDVDTVVPKVYLLIIFSLSFS